MKTQTVGRSPLVCSRLAYGCMRIAGTWNPNDVTPERAAVARKSLLTAYESGYTLFDHADIYCAGAGETLHGNLLKETPSLRKDILIATKCGIRFGGDPDPGSPHRYDFSAKHILWSCEQSLKRLHTDVIDIYQLHRPDLLMDPAEVAGAFEALHTSGKVRFFGVSNFSASFVLTLQEALPDPLVVNQVEIHLGRLDCFNDGTLDQCIARQITPLSWSPLGGGMLGTGGNLDAKNPRFAVLTLLRQTMDQIAGKYGVSRTAVALAWLLKHPSKIIPIVGSNNADHIRDAVTADAVDLSREDWYRLLLAARGQPLP